MMNETIKSYKSDNKGSAMITGLVVSTVLMVLCLSLLLIAYSLFLSTANSTSDLPNREMLFSAAEALEHELLDFSMEYDADLLLSDPTGHDFWQYIDNTIWKGFVLTPGTENKYTQQVNAGYWMYYDPLDTSGYHNDLEKCSKYFNLTSIGSVKIVVQLYWELPKEFDGDASKRENKSGTLLNAIYRMYDNKGTLLVKTDRKYILSISTTTTTTSAFQVNSPTEVYNQNSIIINFICYSNWGTGSNCNFDIINNTGSTVYDWYFIVKTNNTIHSDNGCKHDLISVNDGIYTYKFYNPNRPLYNGNNGSVIQYVGGEPCEWVPILTQFNEMQNTSIGGSSSSETKIKWTRIGEEIINPGGGN